MSVYLAGWLAGWVAGWVTAVCGNTLFGKTEQDNSMKFRTLPSPSKLARGIENEQNRSTDTPTAHTKIIFKIRF